MRTTKALDNSTQHIPGKENVFHNRFLPDLTGCRNDRTKREQDVQHLL